MTARPVTNADAADTCIDPLMDGARFIFETPPDPEPLWGTGNQVLWAEGESLIIVGGQGLGKSTLAQQLALGRIGIEPYTSLLGHPVALQPAWPVLYLAMDRPRQISRSFRRMVTKDMWGVLEQRLRVWKGPPAVDIAKNPRVLLNMASDAWTNAGTVIVDSIKDAAIGLSDDEVGAGWNRARQILLNSNIQLIELHHQRKAVQGGGKRTPSIDDVYGSTWITSGAGSVIMLDGKPGDSVVGLHHIKQPAEEVGPLKVMHDHTTGRSTVFHAADLVAMASRPEGLTAVEAARALFDTAQPTASEKEKARRRLNSLTDGGGLYLVDEGDRATNRPARWSTRAPTLLDGV